MEPKKLPELSSALEKFLTTAKTKNLGLVVLAFSSMPVSARLSLQIARRLIENCDPKVCVVAVIAKHRTKTAGWLPSLERIQLVDIPSIKSDENNRTLPSLGSDRSFEVLSPEDVDENSPQTSILECLKGKFCCIFNCINRKEEIREMKCKIEKYMKENRLLVVHEAPFGKLFPRMDCIICHGGLGTVGTAMKSGIPTIVTG